MMATRSAEIRQRRNRYDRDYQRRMRAGETVSRRRAVEFMPPSDRANYLRVAEVVALVTGVPIGDFTFAQRRVCGVMRPRQMAHLMTVYLTVTALGIRAARVARVLDLERSNITRICRKAEDMRDDPKLDQLLERIEQMLAGGFN